MSVESLKEFQSKGGRSRSPKKLKAAGINLKIARLRLAAIVEAAKEGKEKKA